ncbi:MAG TPA: four helix bundle protein [Flavisolibacter sp.]|nr:four helix bundle protein [Flavisolibacter sp.]
MFLNLKHKTLHVYVAARELTKEVYKISELLPVTERFNMVQQIRRAALSVKLNLAEGSTRRSEVERKRYIEIARGSVVEIDAALETAIDLDYFKTEQLTKMGELLNKCFAMLTKMLG